MRIASPLRALVVLIFAVGLATTAFATSFGLRAPSPDRLRAGKAARAGTAAADLPGLLSAVRSGGLPQDAGECDLYTTSCGQTVQSALTQDDCKLDDGTVVDFWVFAGSAGDKVTVDLSSTAFDPFLFLLDPSPEVVAVDDDGGNGLNARIVHVLDVSGEWTIAPNNIVPGQYGSYTLSLKCKESGPGGPSGPVAVPQHLTAVPFSPTEVELRWDDLADNEAAYRIELAEGAGAFADLGTVSPDTEIAEIFDLVPGTDYRFRVRAENTTHVSDWSNTASTRTFVEVGAACVPGPNVLCLNDDRFQVQVSFRTKNTANKTGQTGLARTVPTQSDDSGLLWFFGPENWEMLIKLLDGCNNNGHFWTFFAATTDVEVNVHVGDTETGAEATYYNPLGQPANAVTDTRAFDTCP